VPANGTVEGWRFAATDQTADRPPRTTPIFADICDPSNDPGDGQKQVAIITD